MLIRTISAIALLLVAVCPSQGQDALSVRSKHGWTNVFAGKRTTLECQVSALAATEATLFWSVSVERGIIARGQRALNLVPGKSEDVSIEVDFPEVRPGLVVPGALVMEVRAKGGQRTESVLALHVFSPDVTANRQQLVKSFEITLFDPAQKTGAALKSSQIPYQLTDGPKGSGTGLMIYGEGIEPSRQAPCWQAAMEAAASGRKVILLASSGSSLNLTGLLTTSDVGPSSVSLQRSDVIRELDKRLDAKAWQEPGRLVASSLHWSVKGSTPQMDLRDDSEGWPWLDVRYPNGGRLVWTGMGVTESWEATPAARYLFVKLLEEVMVEKPEAGGTKHVVK